MNIGGFQDSLYMPIDDVVLGDSGDATVVANGNLAVTWAGSTLDPSFDEDDVLTDFDSDLGLRGASPLSWRPRQQATSTTAWRCSACR